MASENISELNALRNYVEKSYSKLRHPSTRKKVSELLSKQEPLSEEKVLYRGVKSYHPTNVTAFTPYFPTDFFSTSEDLDTAKCFMQYIVGGHNCCVFEIRVQPGIRMLNVQSFLNLPEYFSFEQEWLVEGGGLFFADKQKTTPGFAKKDKKGYFTTYYFPSCTVSGCTTMGGQRLRPLPQTRRKNRTRRLMKKLR